MIPHFHQQTTRTIDWHSWSKTGKNMKLQRRRCWMTVSFILIVSIFFFIILLGSIFLTRNSEKPSEHASADSMHRQSTSSPRFIYIDVGCYNGETIEYFLHFYANSSLYDIITFEPDPENFLLCERTLRQAKYAHLNIEIIRKVAWIRDEKILLRVGEGNRSRINPNASDVSDSIELEAIDFSAWLGQLVTSKSTKVHMKISMAGAEVTVLEKLVLDETLPLVDRYEIEWLDRNNPRLRAKRIYVQLMIESYGYDCLYYTRLDDARKAFRRNETWNSVPKLYDWRPLQEADTYAHYHQRPLMPNPVLHPKRRISNM